MDSSLTTCNLGGFFSHYAWYFSFLLFEALLDCFVLSVDNFYTSLDEDNEETIEEDGTREEGHEEEDKGGLVSTSSSFNDGSELPDTKEEL